jgi:hypothetical protein
MMPIVTRARREWLDGLLLCPETAVLFVSALQPLSVTATAVSSIAARTPARVTVCAKTSIKDIA